MARASACRFDEEENRGETERDRERLTPVRVPSTRVPRTVPALVENVMNRLKFEWTIRVVGPSVPDRICAAAAACRAYMKYRRRVVAIWCGCSSGVQHCREDKQHRKVFFHSRFEIENNFGVGRRHTSLSHT